MLITEKTVAKENKSIARELGVKIIKGNKRTRSNIGIHLLKPDAFEISDALDSCASAGFETIYVYDGRSWK